MDITEADTLSILRTVILSVVSCEVIRGQVNRVSMPTGNFVVLTPTSLIPLETNTDTYTATERIIARPARMDIQVDCYGSNAFDNSASIAAILRDDYAAEQFSNSGYAVQTLYAGDAQQMPLQDAQDQFLQRWTFEACLQVNPKLTLSQETANTLTVGVFDVDVEYPPE